MAVKYEEVEILREGIKYDRPSKGSFALNMLRRYGAWEVRQGFGQLTQFDCRLTNNVTGAAVEWGYQKHLGSHTVHTDFGHDQIVSVFRARVLTSEVKGYTCQDTSIYVVSIYDVTTGERWEEPLYRHTSEGGLTRDDMYMRRGQYESNRDFDLQAWIFAGGDETFSFVEVRDIVYFGSPNTELYGYSPCTFRGNRLRHVSGAHEWKWAPPYSESSLIWRVKPSPGAFPEVYNYRTKSGVPSPLALTSWGSRLVVAGNDREVFFSQRDRPTVFIDEDIILVPTEKKITALASMGQSIYIFTETETFMYQPSASGQTPLASMGMEPVRISDSIGCISQACVTKKDNAAVWLSKQGVHVSGGGLDIQTISGPIAPLFTDFITDPATTFFSTVTAQTGVVNLSLPQRNSVITLNTDGAHVTYSELLDAALVTLPEERVSLCFAEDQWSVWSYESNTVSSVGAAQNILAPWLTAIGKRLFVVGSRDTQVLTDAAIYGGNSGTVDDDATSQSAYILEYGRGGAIDRSIDDEDHRTVAGKYISHLENVPSPSWLVMGEWLPVEQKYKFPGTTPATPNGVSAPNAPGRTVLVPLYLVPNARFDRDPITEVITKVEIYFRFDNTNWSPVFEAVAPSSNINIILPPERLASATGWTAGAGLARCETTAGVADDDGNVIHLIWDGAAATHQGTPVLNVVPDRLNPIAYIPMHTLAASTRDVSGMGIMKHGANPWCLLSDATSPTKNTYQSSALVWREWRLYNVRKEDSVAQPVDWAYMSEDVALPDDTRIKARGLSVRLLSHDQGFDVTGNWTQGIFNTMMAADLKTWTAQPVDYVGGTTFTSPVSITTNLYPTALTEGTIRGRIRAAAMQKATFLTYAAYGNPAVTTFEAKNCLVGDEQVDEITTSDSVKGTSVATMLFGFMRNPAERLKLESVKLLYRVVGANRRRRGR